MESIVGKFMATLHAAALRRHHGDVELRSREQRIVVGNGLVRKGESVLDGLGHLSHGKRHFQYLVGMVRLGRLALSTTPVTIPSSCMITLSAVLPNGGTN